MCCAYGAWKSIGRIVYWIEELELSIYKVVMYVSTYIVSGSIGEMRKPNDNAVQYEVLIKGCALVDENVCSLVMFGEKANQN